MTVDIQLVVGTTTVEMNIAVKLYICFGYPCVEIIGIFRNEYFPDIPLHRFGFLLLGVQMCIRDSR